MAAHAEPEVNGATPPSDELCRLRSELNMLRDRHTALIQRQRSEGGCCNCFHDQAASEKQLEELRRELAFQAAQRVEAEAQLDAAADKTEATVQQEKADLQQELEMACAEAAAAREELSELQKDRDALQVQLGGMLETKSALKTQVQAGEHERWELEQHVAVQQGIIELLKEQLVSSEQSKAHLFEEQCVLQAQKVALESELVKLRAVVEELGQVQKGQQEQLEVMNEEHNSLVYQEQLRRTRERTEQALAATAYADAARTSAVKESLEKTLEELQSELEQERKARQTGQRELELLLIEVGEQFGDDKSSALKAAVDVHMGLQSGLQIEQWLLEFSSRRSKSEKSKSGSESTNSSSPMQRLEARCGKARSNGRSDQTKEDKSCNRGDIENDIVVSSKGSILSPLQKRAQQVTQNEQIDQ